jgi:hypothetical protein
MVDELAAEYGWSKEAIFETVYHEEALELLKKIAKRRSANYYELFCITCAPHSSEEFRTELLKRYMAKTLELKQGKLDESGVDFLRKLSGGR